MKHSGKLFALACLMLAVYTLLPSAKYSDDDTGRRIKNESEIKEDEVENEDITPKRGDDSPAKKETADAKTASAEADLLLCASQGWYAKHMKNGERPPLPPEMSYLSEHNGYFLGEDEKKIYLTFDAGYENGNVAKILDVLKEKNVPGAFFILDNLVTSNTDLVKRMIDEGHTVCNHTAKHKDMTKMTTKEEFAAELEKMENIYREYMGCEIARFYRPPEGKLNEENLVWADELGYKTVMWSFAYADWDNGNQPSEDSAREKILSCTHNGEIILLHPTSSTNASILGSLIDEWRSMGYAFGRLEELGGGNGNE